MRIYVLKVWYHFLEVNSKTARVKTMKHVKCCLYFCVHNCIFLVFSSIDYQKVLWKPKLVGEKKQKIGLEWVCVAEGRCRDKFIWESKKEARFYIGKIVNVMLKTFLSKIMTLLLLDMLSFGWKFTKRYYWTKSINQRIKMSILFKLKFFHNSLTDKCT